MSRSPQLTGRGLMLLLLAGIAFTLAVLTVIALRGGGEHDAPLPVDVELARRPIPAGDGSGAVLADVVIVRNLSDQPIPNLTIAINGQYYLYRQSPLEAGEELVLPQEVFATKSNQRFVPGRWPITTVTVTGRLPSGARGVTEVGFAEENAAERRERPTEDTAGQGGHRGRGGWTSSDRSLQASRLRYGVC